MKHTTLLLFLLLGLTGMQLSAQSYDLAGGVRLGTDWGATARLRVAKKATIEGILQSSLKRDETMVTLMALKHNPVLTRRFNVFVGGGLHKGWTGTDVFDAEGNKLYEAPFGVTLAAGAEMTLMRVNVSWDMKPAINLVGGEKSVYMQTGISLRYVLSKKNDLWGKPSQRRKKKRQRERAKRKKNGDSDKKPWEIWKKS